MIAQIEQAIFELEKKDKNRFEELVMAVFRYQAENNSVYKKYLLLLNKDISTIQKIENIPFLPIELFKTHTILTKGKGSSNKPEHIFTSSGTTNQLSPSRHYVKSLGLYEKSFYQSFKYFYGNPEKYCWLALLPAYLERQGSSLVYMAHHFISNSPHSESGFYLYNYEKLQQKLQTLEAQKKPAILLGVSFALWELAEKHPLPLYHTIIMETGGMKGRKKEIIRAALHGILKKGFRCNDIHSEYGMTELLSQAYSKGKGIFYTPPWMKILCRSINDPFHIYKQEGSGGINIIDLANIHSCSFIATQDLGKVYTDGSFEILGRFDNSDVRGCNLMLA